MSTFNYTAFVMGAAVVVFLYTAGLLPQGESGGVADGQSNQSIYAQIENGLTYPLGDAIGWVPGEADGSALYRTGTIGDITVVEQFVEVIAAASRAPNDAVYQILTSLSASAGIVAYADPLMDSFSDPQDVGMDPDGARAVGLHLARLSTEIEAVKLGMLLLGSFGAEEDEDILLSLGRHEEFTLYTTIALSNLSQNAEEDLWDLAKELDGWGKIHIVRRLAASQNPEIKGWLLREGYKNSIGDGELATIVAIGGDLASALAAEEIDKELLLSTDQLIASLAAQEQGRGLVALPDAAFIVSRYMAHVESHEATLERLHALTEVDKLVSQLSLVARLNARSAGWTTKAHGHVQSAVRSSLANPHWTALVTEGLRSSDEDQFARANYLAEDLGMETWDVHWSRLEEKPGDELRWLSVLSRVNEERLEQVLNLAREVLTDGAAENGAQSDSVTSAVLKHLKPFPGQGWFLVEHALSKTNADQRNEALDTLSSWNREQWPSGAVTTLSERSEIETDPKLKARLAALLAGS